MRLGLFGVATVVAVMGAPSIRGASARRDAAITLHAPAAPQSAQNPAYSPDGRQLLLTIFRNGYNGGPAGLYILDRGSGAITTLVDDPQSDSVNLPGSSWSRAGDLVVFSSDREDRQEVWTVNARTGALFRVTRNVDEGESIEPSFSPAGDWIVFEVAKKTSGDKRFGALWKIRSDGTQLTRLTGGTGAPFDDRQPNWSPRGDQIVFQRRPLGNRPLGSVHDQS